MNLNSIYITPTTISGLVEAFSTNIRPVRRIFLISSILEALRLRGFSFLPINPVFVVTLDKDNRVCIIGISL